MIPYPKIPGDVARGRDAQRGRWWPRPAWTDARDGDATPSVVLDEMLAEFTSRWECGDVPRAEDYVERLRPDSPEDFVDLVYHEFCLAEADGLKPSPEEYAARFPSYSEVLTRLFRLHDAMRSSEPRIWEAPKEDEGLPAPEVGDEIGPYRLRRELGRGALARVFLAEQSDLDNRHVVVKVSTRVTTEPQLLARARHPNIVEVLRHGLVDNGSLQFVSMPFLGGATLSAVLSERRRRPRTCSGREFLADLDRVSAPEYPVCARSRPARDLLAGHSFPAASAWVVARLADALDFAYGRGVLHGDVKPSNVLLTAEATPMLVDFNLAVGWHPEVAGDVKDIPGDVGGTLAYMAPERLRSVAGKEPAAPPTAAERHRADIYSLGVVFLELLTGRTPEIPVSGGKGVSLQKLASAYFNTRLQGGDVMIRAAHASVAPGLRSILEKCLATDPIDRYRRAADLAEDLDRWRTDRPLLVANEPVFPSGAVRWVHGHRTTLTAAALGLAVSAGATMLTWRRAESDRIGQMAYRYSLLAVGDDFSRRMGSGRLVSKEDRYETAKRNLEIYHVLGGDWRRRDEFRNLPPFERDDLEVWLLEQALRFANALGERPDPHDWQRGLDCLEGVSAEAPFGPLLAAARSLRRKLGQPERRHPLPRTAWDADRSWMEDYLKGVESELRGGEHDALVCYQAVLGRRGTSFRASYRAAAVAFHQKDYKAAAHYMRACVDQRPDNPILRHQLAGCLFGDDRLRDADEQYDKVRNLDPDYAESFLSRTFVRLRLGQVAEYLKDMRRYDTLRGQRAPLPSGPSPLTLSDASFPTAQPVDDDPRLRRTSAGNSDEIEVRLALGQQLAGDNQHELALAEIDRVLAIEPENLPAHYSRAFQLRRLKRDGSEREFAWVVDDPRIAGFIRAYPRMIDAFHNTVYDQLADYRYAEAVETARKGLSIYETIRPVSDPQFPDRMAESRFMLALACFQLGQHAREDPALKKEAREHLAEALKVAPAHTNSRLAVYPELGSLLDDSAPRIIP